MIKSIQLVKNYDAYADKSPSPVLVHFNFENKLLGYGIEYVPEAHGLILSIGLIREGKYSAYPIRIDPENHLPNDNDEWGLFVFHFRRCVEAYASAAGKYPEDIDMEFGDCCIAISQNPERVKFLAENREVSRFVELLRQNIPTEGVH